MHIVDSPVFFSHCLILHYDKGDFKMKYKTVLTLYFWKLFCIKAPTRHGEIFIRLKDFGKVIVRVKFIVIKVDHGSLFTTCLVTCLLLFSSLCFYDICMWDLFKQYPCKHALFHYFHEISNYFENSFPLHVNFIGPALRSQTALKNCSIYTWRFHCGNFPNDNKIL